MAKNWSFRRTTIKYNRNKDLLLVLLLLIPIFPDRSSAITPYHPHWNHHNHVHKRVMRPFALARSTTRPPLKRWRPPPSSPTQGMVILHPVPSLPPYLHRVSTSTLPQPFYDTSSFNNIKPTKKCEGRKNILNDIGIVSLITAVMSSTFGLYTIVVNSVTSNNVSIISGILSLLLWAPSTLITLMNKSGDFIYLISNALNGISLINAVFSIIAIIFGTLDVLTSAAAETIGLASLFLSIVATFPDYLDSLIELIYQVGNRRRLEAFVENYGCSVPSILTVAGKPLYDILDRLLIDSVKVKSNAVPPTNNR